MKKSHLRLAQAISFALLSSLTMAMLAGARADSGNHAKLSHTDRFLLNFVNRNTFNAPHGPHLGRHHLRGFETEYYPYVYRGYPYGHGDGYPYGHGDMNHSIGDVLPAGRLIMQTHPPEAAVLVDGHPVAKGGDDTYQIGLLVGPHRVQVFADGYSTYEREIAIEMGHHHRLHITLEPK